MVRELKATQSSKQNKPKKKKKENGEFWLLFLVQEKWFFFQLNALIKTIYFHTDEINGGVWPFFKTVSQNGEGKYKKRKQQRLVGEQKYKKNNSVEGTTKTKWTHKLKKRKNTEQRKAANLLLAGVN